MDKNSATHANILQPVTIGASPFKSRYKHEMFFDKRKNSTPLKIKSTVRKPKNISGGFDY